MIVSSISFAVSKQFEKHSMDVKVLAESGDVFTSNKDKNIILNLDLLKLIDQQHVTITTSSSFESLVSELSNSNQKVYPVVDEKNKLVGVIDFDLIRPIVFNPYRIKFTKLEEVITVPKTIINYEDGMEFIIDQFENERSDILPVIRYGKYFGMISKLQLLEAYRYKLKEMIIE